MPKRKHPLPVVRRQRLTLAKVISFMDGFYDEVHDIATKWDGPPPLIPPELREEWLRRIDKPLLDFLMQAGVRPRKR